MIKKVVVSTEPNFQLNKETLTELFKRLNKSIYFYSSGDKYGDACQPLIDGDEYFCAFTEPCEPLTKSLDDDWWRAHHINQYCWDRECPILIAIVEEFGKEKTGLKVIEIPYDVQYYIEIYGDGWGLEYIKEKSREWH